MNTGSITGIRGINGDIIWSDQCIVYVNFLLWALLPHQINFVGDTLLQQFIVSILKVKQLQTAVNISTWFQAGFSSVLSAPVTASWEH